MIDRIRYGLGVLSVISLPPGLLLWLIIHPWARRWRRLGPMRTYLIVVPVVIALGAVLFRFRAPLLGADLGLNRGLLAIAAVLYGVMTWLELHYWKQLSIRTLVGVPELSRAGPRAGTLLKDGIYGTVRHPRYLSAGIGVMANVLIVNHTGLYVVFLLIVPAGLVMLMFEERELVDRFGEEYRQYQRDVPQLVPRWRSRK